MTTRVLVIASLVLWIVVAGVLAFVLLRSYSEPAPDGRTQVRVTPAEREFILAQMRGMLATVQGITDGLATGNHQRVAETARRGGQVAMAVKPALMVKLPAPFKQLSMQLHTGFDELADAAEAGAPTERLMAQLSGQLATCVGCHAAYSLTSQAAP